MIELRFPKKFLWGAATSAHQTEGNNTNNDWWQAETSGLVPSRSGIACDFYNRFAQDFDLAKQLGHNAHRFSVEWSRIEPENGEFSQEAATHYRRMILYLREKGMEPIITLHHFTNPLWFAKIGGWENPRAAKIFARYVNFCLEHFGDYINWWVTINEPTVAFAMNYHEGVWPPFKKSYRLGLKVLLNLSAAHNQAYKLIKKHRPGVKVGIAHNVAAFVPAHKYNFLEMLAVKFFKFFNNDYFLRLIKNHYDYIGVNYYFYRKVYWNKKPGFLAMHSTTQSDLGWRIEPQGLLQVLRELSKYKKPLLITENGLADAKDIQRWPFILNHLLMVYTAIAEGIDVRGYLYWSLIDNLEWSEGFEPRFGLIEVDYQTQKRTVRESAWKFSQIIKQNAIDPSTVKQTIEKRPLLYSEVLQRYLNKITRLKPEI